MKSKLLVPLIATLVSVGCGGGGSSAGNGPNQGPPPPPPSTTLTGRFKDSNTEGLSYSTRTQSGTTDSLGKFSYETGETVEFSVGGVLIGSAEALPVLTPVDLVVGGSSNDPTVLNIVRFLMMLDQNEDPTDGIEISAAVRDIAVNWQQVDFSSGSFEGDIAIIISDVASVDNRVAAIVDGLTAKTHLEQTSRCLMSGLFTGTYTGPSSGAVFFLVNPSTGAIKATYPGAAADFQSIAPPVIDQLRNLRVEAIDGSGDDFEGRFDSYNEISGVWTFGQDSGAFSATRERPDRDAIYRYSGEWSTSLVRPSIEGLQVFNVDAQGQFEGIGPVVGGNRYDITGDIDGQNITMVVSSSGTTLQGTIDGELNAQLTGTNSQGATVFSSAVGCQLN